MDCYRCVRVPRKSHPYHRRLRPRRVICASMRSVLSMSARSTRRSSCPRPITSNLSSRTVTASVASVAPSFPAVFPVGKVNESLRLSADSAFPTSARRLKEPKLSPRFPHTDEKRQHLYCVSDGRPLRRTGKTRVLKSDD